MALPEQAPSEQALPMQAPSEQALPERDRIGISDLINLHGHLMDAGELDQAGELVTADVTYDLGDFGLGSLHGAAAIHDAALAMGQANPVGYHITNIVITRI